MFKKLNDINEALPAMFAIETLYLLIGEVIILLLPIADTAATVRCMMGFLAGVIYSLFCSVHMSFRIRKVIYGGEGSTKTYVIGYIIRLMVMIVLFAVLYLLNIGDLLCAVIGMFSMKVAAYLQPFADKILCHYLRQ